MNWWMPRCSGPHVIASATCWSDIYPPGDLSLASRPNLLLGYRLGAKQPDWFITSTRRNSCTSRCQLTSSSTDIHPLLNLVWPLQPHWYYTHILSDMAFNRPSAGSESFMPCTWTEANPDTNLIVLMLRAWSDRLLLLADWAATASRSGSRPTSG